MDLDTDPDFDSSTDELPTEFGAPLPSPGPSSYVETPLSPSLDVDTSASAAGSGRRRPPSNMRRLLFDLTRSPAASTSRQAYRRKALRRTLRGTLDRVNVLGDDGSYGHTGCVNALSWALDGDVLISGGDDTTVRLWRLDSNDSETPYPYKCDAVIHTGHTGNIFNAHLLPSSSRIATVAGDRQVRVCDAERALTTSSQGRETEFSTAQSCISVLKCHKGRTKRIVTEESPDVFLTVAEDGTVRQHDLREPHRCRTNCPQPLVTLPHDLSTLALSPLVPYLFVVAGESPYGYLFDRRQVGRSLRSEWGLPCTDEDYVTCVRRFGRAQRGTDEQKGAEHVTGARMAQTNGHEVLLSYSADAVYLYSIRDDAHVPSRRPTAVLSPNATNSKSPSPKREVDSLQNLLPQRSDRGSGSDTNSDDDVDLDEDERRLSEALDAFARETSEPSEEETNMPSEAEMDVKFKSPTIMPRRRFYGHCNVETVKDVNFIGADDEYVASGSDDGNFFLWDKDTGKVHGIYEGDGSVVNVIESHPRLPLIACSGIDTTVKLFAPTEKTPVFSRVENAERVMTRNAATSRRSLRQQMGIASLFLQYRSALRRIADAEISTEGADPDVQCTFQ